MANEYEWPTSERPVIIKLKPANELWSILADTIALIRLMVPKVNVPVTVKVPGGFITEHITVDEDIAEDIKHLVLFRSSTKEGAVGNYSIYSVDDNITDWKGSSIPEFLYGNEFKGCRRNELADGNILYYGSDAFNSAERQINVELHK